MNDDLQPLLPEHGARSPPALRSAAHDRFSTATMLHGQMHHYATALRKRWWLLVVSFLFIAGPAIYYALNKAPTFRSQATMWLTGKLNLPGGQTLVSEDLGSYMATQAELIKSQEIQSRAFDRVGWAFPEIMKHATNGHIPFKLTVEASPKNSVLELEAEGSSAKATQAFLDAVMDEYLALKQGSYRQASAGALSGITGQIKEVEKQIEQQQQALTAFGASNNISYLTEHGVSAGSHLARLTEVLSDLRTEHHLLTLITPEQFHDLAKGTQYSFSDIALPGEKAAQAFAGADGASDTAYYQALQQIEVLKAEREQFSRVLRPTHSKMVKLNQEIAGLEQLLKTLKDEGGKQALAQMANRKKSLELQIENLEAQYHDWETNATEANRKLADFDRMKQDLQRSQALYDRLLGLLQTVDLDKSINQEPLSRLAPASPGRPSSAVKFKIAAAGLFLAFVAAAGLLLLSESLDDRFTSATELSGHLSEEVIVQIPESRLSQNNAVRRLPRHPDEEHAFVESFRNLRASLFLGSLDGVRPGIIVVTSAVPKEGKSTVAANLASSLAQAGSKVLVIDADLWRGSLHRLFGVSPKAGLCEVLNHSVSVKDAIVRVTPGPKGCGHPNDEPRPQKKAHPSSPLFLLPAGGPDPDNGEPFLRGEMNVLLRDLAKQYSYIIIDSPPVLATNDVINLASEADGILMVVRASFTSSRMVREALTRLHRCNLKILGIIYNRAAPSGDYYYRYSHAYHGAGSQNGRANSPVGETLAKKDQFDGES